MIYLPCNHLQHGFQTRSWLSIERTTVGWHSDDTHQNSFETNHTHTKRRIAKICGRIGPRQLRRLVHRMPGRCFLIYWNLNEKPLRNRAECLGASLIGSISNTWYHEHWEGCRGWTEEQRISHSPKRILPRTESEVRCMLRPCNTQCIQTDGS